MSDVSCTRCRERGAELALGILDGRERAEALYHLDSCPECREYVRDLTVLGNEVTALVPGVEPPIGFEQRVLDRLPVPAAPPRRAWRVPVAAAAAAVLVAAGWAIGAATDLGGAPAAPAVSGQVGENGVVDAALTSGTRPVGEVYVHPGRYPWVSMAIELHRPVTGTVSCELVRRGGQAVPVGDFQVTGGHGYWAGPVDVDPGSLSGARIVGSDGDVLATATFGG